MPAWLFGGTRQRTTRLEKSASEGDTRIDDNSGGSLQTIETGSDFPIGNMLTSNSRWPEPTVSQAAARRARMLGKWQGLIDCSD
jgi:hypothetical protein